MNCPKCGNILRESKKSQDYMLCDVCRKKYFIEDLEYKLEKPVNKKGHGCLISVLIVLGVLIALSVFVGIIFSNSEEPEKVSEIEENDTLSEIQNNASSKQEEHSPFKKGEVIEYGDMQIVLTKYLEHYGDEWAKPNDGNIFVFVEFEISNNSNEEKAISSMLSFDSYCDDYLLEYSGNAWMALSSSENTQGLDGTIVPGKKMKGSLALEVPENWKEIEVYFVDNLWTDRKLSFEINKQ